MLTNLTNYVKKLKTEKNLSNAQIAQLSKISESTISRLLKGENKGIDLATCVEIIRALDGSMDEACGFMHAIPPSADAPHTCSECAKFASMKEELTELYIDEVRKDIIETTNQRMAEVYRIHEERVKSERAHYEQNLTTLKESNKERIDNLMKIIDARAKTINRLSLICGAMAIALIALLVLIIFFPTNPILKW